MKSREKLAEKKLVGFIATRNIAHCSRPEINQAAVQLAWYVGSQQKQLFSSPGAWDLTWTKGVLGNENTDTFSGSLGWLWTRHSLCPTIKLIEEETVVWPREVPYSTVILQQTWQSYSVQIPTLTRELTLNWRHKMNFYNNFSTFFMEDSFTFWVLFSGLFSLSFCTLSSMVFVYSLIFTSEWTLFLVFLLCLNILLSFPSFFLPCPLLTSKSLGDHS